MSILILTLCEPKLHSILATTSLTCQHTFWWIILYILMPENINLMTVFEHIKTTFRKGSR